MELETHREQMNVLRQQKHQLQENMRDYSELKRETLEHQTHIRLLTQRLEETHEENQRLARGPSHVDGDFTTVINMFRVNRLGNM